MFFDKNGLNIEKPVERKIESCFIREDFRRVKSDSFKRITHYSDCIEYYSRQIMDKINIENIRNQKMRIIVSAKNGLLKSVVEDLMKEVKINVKFYKDPKDLVGLSKEVVASNANLGVYFPDEAENAVIIDEKGNILFDEMYDTLKALVYLKLINVKTLAAPVTASSSIEAIAKMRGYNYISTKISQKAVLDTYLKTEKNLNRRNIIDAYVTTLDGLNVVMLIINLIAESNLTIRGLISKIPKYYRKKQEIVCPWNMKGKVMRTIIEDSSSNSIELLEGVKLNYGNTWALILPDSDEPMCRIYVEGKNLQDVESLSESLSQKISNITKIK